MILLTGTFEPFDRPRAERIGADAIVSKPFDSQQLLRQVEALLSAAAASRWTLGGRDVALRIPEEITLGAGAPPGRGAEVEPFDAGFSPEDFTGSIRVPTGDPFEEEFGRADVDSAIEAFEKVGEPANPRRRPRCRLRRLPVPGGGGRGRIFLARRRARASGGRRAQPLDDLRRCRPPRALRAARRDAEVPRRRGADRRDRRGDAFDLRPTEPFPTPAAPAPNDRGDQRRHAAEGCSSCRLRPSRSRSRRRRRPPRSRRARPAAPPQELEALAQTSSIPELAQMLSSVSRGGELSDADIDRLAARIVEKLSDRVIREIAWEVIPDMAEIVIKQRIKELEAGME